MSQFYFGFAVNLLTGVVFAIATYVCFVRVRHKRNNSLLLLGSTSLVFGLMIFLQAISYMILLENQGLAFVLKQLSIIFSILGYIFVFVFVNYVWFERIRFILVIPVIIVGTLELASMFFTNGLVIYTFMEEEVIIAVSIGKTGYLLYFELILSQIVGNLVIVAYFTKSYIEAPKKLKRPAFSIMIYIWTSIGLAICIAVMVRTFSMGQLTLFLYGLNYLIIAIGYVLICVIVIHHPQLLCILPFHVDRLLIIYNASGVTLYEFQFSAQKFDGRLFGGLMQGLQSMSVEVLQKGQITQINLESGVLTFKKMDLFTIGLLSSRSSQMLNRSFEAFTLAFNTQFRAVLEQFQGKLDAFNEADQLVHTYFEYVPISAGE